MILETYQSTAVLNILRKGEVYIAKPSISFKGAYAALIDILGLNCQCPIFTVVKGRKQNTGGRISASVQLVLDVPDDKIKLTEYNAWADFMYCYKFSKPGDYKKLKPDCEEVSIRRYQDMMDDLKSQRPLAEYRYPQAVLEQIEPEWLVSFKILGEQNAAGRTRGDIIEKILNIFRD